MHSTRAWMVALALTGCSFDESGVGPDDGGSQTTDAPTVDAAGPGPDGRSIDGALPPDAAPDAPVDSAPPDQDGDGIADGDDNCAEVPNPGQQDEDVDLVGDVCDNCPTVDNPLQENDGEVTNGIEADGVGDACDPRPSGGGDAIGFFDGFNGPTSVASWTSVAGTWSVSAGAMHQTSQARIGSAVYWNGGSPTRARAVADMIIDVIVPALDINDDSRSLGLLGQYDSNANTGYLCVEYADPNAIASTTSLLIYEFAGNGGNVLDFTGLAWDMAVADPVRAQFTVKPTTSRQTCSLHRAAGGSLSRTADDGTYTSGRLALYTDSVAATFPYFIVYTLGQ